MGYMSNKALIIAVSLLVTMAITSAVLIIVNQVTGVYKQVYETDTLIQSAFDEFDQYNNTVKTQLDLLNTAKKYKDNQNVYVTKKAVNDITGIGNVKSNKLNDEKGIEELSKEIDESKLEYGTVNVDAKKASTEYKTYVLKFDENVVIVFN